MKLLAIKINLFIVFLLTGINFSSLLNNYFLSDNYFNKLLNYEHKKHIASKSDNNVINNNAVNYENLIKNKQKFNSNTLDGVYVNYNMSQNSYVSLIGSDLGFMILVDRFKVNGSCNLLVNTPNKLYDNTYSHLYLSYIIGDVLPDQNGIINNDAVWHHTISSCAFNINKNIKDGDNTYQWVLINNGTTIQLLIYTSHNKTSELLYKNYSSSKLVSDVNLQKQIYNLTTGIDVDTKNNIYLSSLNSKLSTISYYLFIHCETQDNKATNKSTFFKDSKVSLSYSSDLNIYDLPVCDLYKYNDNYCSEYYYEPVNQYRIVSNTLKYSYLSDTKIGLEETKNTNSIFPVFYIRNAGYDSNNKISNNSYYNDLSNGIKSSYFPNGDPTTYTITYQYNLLPIVIILSILLLLLIFCIIYLLFFYNRYRMFIYYINRKIRK